MTIMTMTETTASVCSCLRPRASGGRFCCPAAELTHLRNAVDQVVATLQRELAAPVVIDDDGVLRSTATATVHALSAIRAQQATPGGPTSVRSSGPIHGYSARAVAA